MQAPSEVVRVAVWDRFVRLFHWSLVGCVLVNAFLLDDGETLHRWLGYTASALVLARIVWGFVGSRHARFDDFFPTPMFPAATAAMHDWLKAGPLLAADPVLPLEQAVEAMRLLDAGNVIGKVALKT